MKMKIVFPFELFLSSLSLASLFADRVASPPQWIKIFDSKEVNEKGCELILAVVFDFFQLSFLS